AMGRSETPASRRKPPATAFPDTYQPPRRSSTLPVENRTGRPHLLNSSVRTENFQQEGRRGADRLYGRAARFPRGRRAAGGGALRRGPDHLGRGHPVAAGGGGADGIVAALRAVLRGPPRS